MIRVVITFMVLLVLLIPVFGQNVGIGEPSPLAKLEIRGSGNTLLNSLLVKNGSNSPLLSVNNQGLVGINILNPEVPLHVYSGVDEVVRIRGGFPYISFYKSDVYAGYLWSNGLRFELGTPASSGIPIAIAPGLYPTAVFTPDGYAGIGGVAEPVFPLDVNGRVRLRHNGETPGIWFNNSLNNHSPGFLGLHSADHMGFFGTGIGWGLLMNTNSGDLASAGTMRAINFLYNSPAVRYLSIPYTAFTAINSAEQLYKTGWAFMNGGTSGITCPVYLPQGAVITNVAFSIFDANSVDFECRLYRNPLASSATFEEMVYVRNTGNPGATILDDNSIVSSVINNQSNFYFINVRTINGVTGIEGPWGDFMRFHGVIITYTMNQAQ
jgi:hypothetical protein